MKLKDCLNDNSVRVKSYFGIKIFDFRSHSIHIALLSYYHFEKKCFVVFSFTVIDRKIEPNIGSDHYPISIELSLK